MASVRLGERIENEQIVLLDHDVINAKCVVVDCHLRIPDPSAVGIFDSTFVGSTIECKKTCKKEWVGCFFDTCTFIGKYFDCQFGLDRYPGAMKPGLKNCDYTKASLDMCSFWNCTPDDLRLPGWPHVTIFYPKQNAEDFKSLSADPLLARLQYSLENSSDEEIAVIYDLPKYIKSTIPHLKRRRETAEIFARGRGEPPPPAVAVSIEHVRAQLAAKPYVRM